MNSQVNFDALGGGVSPDVSINLGSLVYTLDVGNAWKSFSRSLLNGATYLFITLCQGSNASDDCVIVALATLGSSQSAYKTVKTYLGLNLNMYATGTDVYVSWSNYTTQQQTAKFYPIEELNYDGF